MGLVRTIHPYRRAQDCVAPHRDQAKPPAYQLVAGRREAPGLRYYLAAVPSGAVGAAVGSGASTVSSSGLS